MFSELQFTELVNAATSSMTHERDEAKAEAKRLRDEAAALRAAAQAEAAAHKAAQSEAAFNLSQLLLKAAQVQAAAARRSVADQQRRLGRIVAVRVTANQTAEDWEPG